MPQNLKNNPKFFLNQVLSIRCLAWTNQIGSLPMQWGAGQMERNREWSDDDKGIIIRFYKFSSFGNFPKIETKSKGWFPLWDGPERIGSDPWFMPSIHPFFFPSPPWYNSFPLPHDIITSFNPHPPSLPIKEPHHITRCTVLSTNCKV